MNDSYKFRFIHDDPRVRYSNSPTGQYWVVRAWFRDEIKEWKSAPIIFQFIGYPPDGVELVTERDFNTVDQAQSWIHQIKMYGERIVTARKKKKLSDTEAGFKLGMGKFRLQRIEAGMVETTLQERTAIYMVLLKEADIVYFEI